MSKLFNGWEGLDVKTGATADPAAGAQLAAITVPAGKTYLFLGGTFTIVCDGNAANRQVNLQIKRDGTNVDSQIYGPGYITAGETIVVSFAPGAASSDVTAYGGMTIGFQCDGIEVPAAGVIQVWIGSIQAGDNISVFRYAYKVR